MSDRLNCPECKTENDGPLPGEHKVTCTSCGLIIVLKKKQGQEPAEAAAPEIRRRSTAPKRGRSRAAATDEDKKPSERRGSRRRASTSSRAVTTLGKVPDLEEDDSGGRRGSHRRRQAADKKNSPVAIWSGIGAVVALIGIVVFMATRGEDKTEEPTKDAKKSSRGAPADTGNSTSTDETASTDGTDVANAAAANAAKKTAPKKAAPKKTAADKNAWKTAFFEATPGTTTEQMEAIKKSVTTLSDLKATRELSNARFQLMEKPRQSIPFLINAMMRLNWAEKDDVSRGWQTIQVLEDIAERREDDDREFMVMQWNGPETPIGAKEAKYRMWAVRAWWRWWDKNRVSWKPAPLDEDG